MDKFIFISYKSEDRELILPYRDWLDSMGVKYWWDDLIHQNWSKEIDEKLAECAAVLGFLTERSTKSGAVYEECRNAAANKKFIPVKLDQSNMEYHFNSLIAFLNYVDLSNASQEKHDGEKIRLIRKIESFVGTPLQIDQRLVITKDPPAFSLEKWIGDSDRLPHIAYLVSLCIFEGQNHDRIQMCSALLERKFTDAGLGKLLQLNNSLTIKQSKLELIGAKSVKYRGAMLQHELEFIRFENHLLNEELLFYIWNELDQLKAPIIVWIEELIDRMPECINDIATSLAKIGRKNFFSIYSIFLNRWLCGRSRDKFRCADIALSLMAGDANVRSYIRDKLFDISDAIQSPEGQSTPVASATVGVANAADPNAEEETTRGETFINDDIAVDLVTGFTGMAMPDLSIHVFKKIEANLLDPTFSPEEKKRITARIQRGIQFILISSKSDSYAKSMLKVFATGIKSWVVEDVENKRSRLPEFIFSILLSGLTVGRSRDSNAISLSDLLTEERQFETNIVNAFALVISGALESGNPIREIYKDLVKKWVGNLVKILPGNAVNKDLKDSIEADRKAFEELFKSVLIHASTEDDRERIQDLTKRICVL